MRDHMSPATRFRKFEFVHHQPLDGFLGIGLTEILGVLALLFVGDLLLVPPVLVCKDLPASKTLYRDNHSIQLYNTYVYVNFYYTPL